MQLKKSCFQIEKMKAKIADQEKRAHAREQAYREEEARVHALKDERMELTAIYRREMELDEQRLSARHRIVLPPSDEENPFGVPSQPIAGGNPFGPGFGYSINSLQSTSDASSSMNPFGSTIADTTTQDTAEVDGATNPFLQDPFAQYDDATRTPERAYKATELAHDHDENPFSNPFEIGNDGSP